MYVTHIFSPYKVVHDCWLTIYDHPLDTKPMTSFVPGACIYIHIWKCLFCRWLFSPSFSKYINIVENWSWSIIFLCVKWIFLSNYYLVLLLYYMTSFLLKITWHDIIITTHYMTLHYMTLLSLHMTLHDIIITTHYMTLHYITSLSLVITTHYIT